MQIGVIRQSIRTTSPQPVIPIKSNAVVVLSSPSRPCYIVMVRLHTLLRQLAAQKLNEKKEKKRKTGAYIIGERGSMCHSLRGRWYVALLLRQELIIEMRNPNVT